MTIAAIMVYVDFDEAAEARVAATAGLARQFNAALMGVAGWALRKFEVAGIPELASPRVGQSSQERISDELVRLGEKFRASVGQNAAGVEWRSSLNFPSEVIAREAGAADLIVIGRDPLPGDVYRTFDLGAIIAVFIGRFFGPFRAIVPIAAGLYAMPWLKFQIANVASAALWAAGVLTPAFVGTRWLMG